MKNKNKIDKSNLSNRVVGLVCIGAIMAKWNTDFDGGLKRISNGTIYGTGVALKYAFRDKWAKLGYPIFSYKTYLPGGDTLSAESFKQRYEDLFEVEDMSEETNYEIAKKLFQAEDVSQFGVVGAINGTNNSSDKQNEDLEGNNKGDKKQTNLGANIPIVGCVQVQPGLNKYKNTVEIETTTLAPFSVNNKNNSTLGSVVLADECHYVYPFTINPIVNKKFIDLGITKGYTNDNYKLFKDTALNCVTEMQSCAKSGCNNELSVFIELDDKTMIPQLDTYVTFSKKENKIGGYNLGFSDLINSLGDKVLSVEIYYNPYSIEVVENIKKAKRFNIFTKEPIPKEEPKEDK